jgi:hypothetical protein
MELQNIVIDFNENTTTTMYQDVHYTVDVMEELIPLRIEFELAYKIVFDRVVVQLTLDQSLSEPRILCMKDEDLTIITINDIEINHNNLYIQILEVKQLIENQIPVNI